MSHGWNGRLEWDEVEDAWRPATNPAGRNPSREWCSEAGCWIRGSLCRWTVQPRWWRGRLGSRGLRVCLRTMVRRGRFRPAQRDSCIPVRRDGRACFVLSRQRVPGRRRVCDRCSEVERRSVGVTKRRATSRQRNRVCHRRLGNRYLHRRSVLRRWERCGQQRRPVGRIPMVFAWDRDRARRSRDVNRRRRF